MKTKIISIALAVVTMLSAVALFSGCSDGEYPVEVANITIESQPKNIVVLDAVSYTHLTLPTNSLV